MTIHVEYLGGPAHGTARAFPYLEIPLPRLYVRHDPTGGGTVYRRLGHVPGAGGRWQYVMVPDGHAPAATTRAGTALLAGAAALAHALDLVRSPPVAPGLLAALDQAETAMDELGDDATTRVLARLIDAVHRCRCTGDPASSLDFAFRAASVALRVDDRWGPSGVLGGAYGW